MSIYPNNVGQMNDKVEQKLCNAFRLLEELHQTKIMFLLTELCMCIKWRGVDIQTQYI